MAKVIENIFWLNLRGGSFSITCTAVRRKPRPFQGANLAFHPTCKTTGSPLPVSAPNPHQHDIREYLLIQTMTSEKKMNNRACKVSEFNFFKKKVDTERKVIITLREKQPHTPTLGWQRCWESPDKEFENTLVNTYGYNGKNRKPQQRTGACGKGARWRFSNGHNNPNWKLKGWGT